MSNRDTLDAAERNHRLEELMELLKKDGGPIHPTTTKVGEVSISTGGMSLHDYFAGQVLYTINSGISAELMASRAYEIADAMLAEREK